jgi:hypothetical protein
MERFVFVTAVTIAIIIGVAAFFGGPHFNFDVDLDSDARGMAPVVQLSSGRMDSQAYTGDELRIKNVVANVVITPEDRSDYLVEIDNSAGRTPMPTVSNEGGRVVIDGQLRGRIRDCTNGGATLRGYGDVSAEQLPRITIRAPRQINVDRGGAGVTEIGPSETATLDFSGCGAASVGDVAGELRLDVAGSGQVRAGSAHSLNADVAGSGEVSVGAVAGDTDLDIAGSGSITVASVTGALSTDGAGSGNVNIQGGAITKAEIDLAGSGDVDIAASVQDLDVSIVGSGDVDVTAPVGNIDAEIAGSGSVSAPSATGTVRRQVFGSGEVRIGH